MNFFDLALLVESNEWILYHGSETKEFVGPLRIGQRDAGWYGRGFYLTAYPTFAKRWCGGKPDCVWQMSVPKGKYAEIQLGEKKDEYLGDAEKANQTSGGWEGWMDNEHAWAEKFTAALKSMGYDGVRVHDKSGAKDVEVVVFDPSKIKVMGKWQEKKI